MLHNIQSEYNEAYREDAYKFYVLLFHWVFSLHNLQGSRDQSLGHYQYIKMTGQEGTVHIIRYSKTGQECKILENSKL